MNRVNGQLEKERYEKLGGCAFDCENIMNIGRFGNKWGCPKKYY